MPEQSAAPSEPAAGAGTPPPSQTPPATPPPASAPPSAPDIPVSRWREALPDELRHAPALKSINDLPAMAKSYLEAQSRLGSSIRIPSKDAGPEDRKAFRARMLEIGKDLGVTALPQEGEDMAPLMRALGMPEAPEGYEIPAIEDPDIKIDMSEAEAMRPLAHQLGLTVKQYKGLVEGITKQRLDTAKGYHQKIQADKAALKKEWGEATDYRLNQLKVFLTEADAPPALRTAVESGTLDSASARWLYGLMESFGDDGSEVAAQGKGSSNSVMTPAEAEDRAAEIEKKMADMPQGTEEYQRLINRRMQLLEIAAAGRY